MGGEFGFALLTVLLSVGSLETELVQALLTATALSMLVGPLLVRYNSRIADRHARPRVHASRPTSRSRTAATRELAKREHVIVCGFGRVGQNLARVLENTRFRVHRARSRSAPRSRCAARPAIAVVYGDATQPEVLRALGLDRASVVVITFADAAASRCAS